MGGIGHHHHGPSKVVRTAWHGESLPADHKVREKRRLWMAVAITGITMVVEVIGGLWTGSLALISDAGHMLTHAAALGVSLAAILFAGRRASPRRTFGNHRAEVLAALFNALTLLLVTVVILREAYLRLVEPAPVMGWQMFAVALVGLVVNLITAWLLHDVGKEDLNVRGAFLHMLGDTFSSVLVVAGAVAIALTGTTWIDPVLSVVVCAVILIWAWGLTRDSLRILMESAPKEMDLDALRTTLTSPEDVVRVDDLHVWTITSGMHAVEARLVVGTNLKLSALDALRADLREELEHHFNLGHVVLEFSLSDERPE